MKCFIQIRFLTFISFWLICLSCKAQHQVHFSQYFLHPSFINVAAIAGYNTFSAALFHRNQWVGMPGAPRYSGVDLSNVIGTNQALGLTAMQDQLGVNSISSVAVNYAIRFKLTKRDNLSFGISPTLLFIRKDLSLLNYENNTDPSLAGTDLNIAAPNMRFGIYFYSSRYYIGIASPNMLKNAIANEAGFVSHSSFDPGNIHLQFHAGHSFSMDQHWEFLPSLLFKYVKTAPQQIDINAQVQYKKKFSLGLGYRSKEIFSLMGNLVIKRDLRLGYAFDWSVGRLSNHNSGTHEFMLVYQLFNLKKKAIISSPRF